MSGAAAMVPVRVRAELASGVAWAAPWGIALDGLLAAELWAQHKAILRAQGDLAPRLGDTAEPGDLDLPLARCELAGPGLWHWAATCAYPDGLAAELPDVRYWTGRPDARACELAAAALPAVISTRQGRYRARRLPLLVTVCQAVIWHGVGDPERIRGLVTGVRAIGKKRSCGEGHVLSWDVTPAPADLWEAGHLHPDGALGRPVPAACLAGRDMPTGGPGTAGLRPPYMHPARQHELLLPATAAS
jgi:CRISPR type IV-associated protein Csf3